MKQTFKKVKLSGSITWRKVNNEAVILNLETSEYYSANHTGTLIWEFLAKNQPTEKIVQALTAEYGISAEEAGSDTEEFYRKLLGMGLITSN